MRPFSPLKAKAWTDKTKVLAWRSVGNKKPIYCLTHAHTHTHLILEQSFYKSSKTSEFVLTRLINLLKIDDEILKKSCFLFN